MKMEIYQIDKTNKYRFDRVSSSNNENSIFYNTNEIRTFFLHKGKLELKIKSKEGIEEAILKEGQGFIVTPYSEYSLFARSDLLALQSSSLIQENNGYPIIEISDLGDRKEEKRLEGHRIIKDPKRVNKPWGHELWISWFKDYHVLKQIGMKAGNMSSLQLHRHKLETNYLVEGEADVIDKFPIDLDLNEDEMRDRVKGVDWNKYKERKKRGMYWTSSPGIIHRVISITDYIAYETSTPELDDVVRLSDVSGRGSGRIVSEHKD